MKNIQSSTMMKRVGVVGLVLLICLLAAASIRSVNSLDTSGFKPAKEVTAQDIERRVHTIENDPTLSPEARQAIAAQVRNHANIGAQKQAQGEGTQVVKPE